MTCGPNRTNLVLARTDLGPAHTDLHPAHADLRPAHANLCPAHAGNQPELTLGALFHGYFHVLRRVQ